MTAEPRVAGTPDGCPACHHRSRWQAILFTTAVAAASFLAGYAAAERRHERLAREENMVRFMECLQAAADLGIITVDRRKLDDAICAGVEGGWGDGG